MRTALISGAIAVLLAASGGTAYALTSSSTPHHPAPTVTATETPLADPVTPAQPAPVDTAATLNESCVMGYEGPAIDSNGYPQSEYSGFIAGPPKGSIIDGNYWAPAMAYQLTLTNNSASTANVAGFAVVFYDASGAEAGSDQRNATGFITPGQALTWTELASVAVNGSGDGGTDASIPAAAATCQLVQWYSG